MKCQFGSLYRSWKLISIKKKRVFCCILLLFVLYKRYFSDSIFYISSDMFCLFLSSSDYKVILYNLEDWNFFFCFSFPIIFFSLKKCSIKKQLFIFDTEFTFESVWKHLWFAFIESSSETTCDEEISPLQAQSTQSASITSFHLST